MTIYVTGSAGFIGSHFAERASRGDRDEEVVPLDIALQGQSNDSIVRILEHAGEGDLVVLLGAQPEVAKFATHPAGDVQTNVLPIVQQMSAAKDASLIILASSFGGLFGEPTMSRLGRPASVEDQPWPVSAYFAGKLALEGYLHTLHRQHRTPYRVARFANVYGGRGPNQLSDWRGVVPDWMQRRREGRPYDVWGELDATRDFIHVSDVVEALWRLWLRARDAPTNGLTVHIGTGELTSIKKLGYAIATTEPRPDSDLPDWELKEPSFTFEAARPGYTVEGSRVDLEEAQAKLRLPNLQPAWEPLNLEEGLRRTWQSYLMEGRE